MLLQEDHIATEHWVLPRIDHCQPRAGGRWQGGRWLWCVVARSLLDALEQAEVSPSKVQTCTIEVWPKGLLVWGPGLLKAILLASIGHLGAGRSSSPKDLEMFSAPRHRAANAVPLSQAGKEGGEEGRQPGLSPAPCLPCVWACRYPEEGVCRPETRSVGWPSQNRAGPG